MSTSQYEGHGYFLPYLINKATTLLNVKLQKILDKEGLTLTHWRVLAFLKNEDDLTINALAEATMTEQSTLSRSLKVLEARGFILRQVNTQDSRSVHIHLLSQGRQMFETIIAQALVIEAQVTQGVSQEEAENVRNVLKRIIENCTKD